MVKYLVGERNASVDVVDKSGNTPLHVAAAGGHFEIVKYLAEERSCSVDVVNIGGVTAYSFAAANGHFDIVKYLAGERSASVDVVNKHGETACALAARFGHREIVQYLVRVRDKLKRKSRKKKQEQRAVLTAMDSSLAQVAVSESALHPVALGMERGVDSHAEMVEEQTLLLMAGTSTSSTVQVAADNGVGSGSITAGVATGKCHSHEVPQHLVCPISSEVMVDPVFTADGHTYERSAIQSWFDRGGATSPLTGVVLEHLRLTPNVMCRSLCRDFLDAHPQLAPSPPQPPPPSPPPPLPPPTPAAAVNSRRRQGARR